MNNGDYQRGRHPNSKATQFRRGDGRRRPGRPKGAKGFWTYVEHEINRPVAVREDGRVVKLPMQKLIIRSVLQKAVNDKAYADVFFTLIYRMENFTDIVEDKVRKILARQAAGLEKIPDFDYKDLSDEDLIKYAKIHGVDGPKTDN